MAKHVPIVVRVPGSGGDDLWLTVTEARQLLKRLRRKLELHHERQYAKRKKERDGH